MKRFATLPKDPEVSIVIIPNEDCPEWKIMKTRFNEMSRKLYDKMDVYLDEAGLDVVVKTMGPYVPRDLGQRSLNILLQDGDAVGFICYGTANGSGYISELYIDEERRRAGYGHLLMSGVIEGFKKAKLKYVDLSVIVTNWPARKLYESLGFKQMSVQYALPL